MFEENFPPVMCAFNYTELAAGSRVRVVLSKHVGKIQTTNQLSSLEKVSMRGYEHKRSSKRIQKVLSCRNSNLQFAGRGEIKRLKHL